MGIQSDRPGHRMHQHEDETAITEAEPDQRQRQQRDRRQRIEHRRHRFQEVRADARHDRERGEQRRQHHAAGIAHQQHLDGRPGASGQDAADDGVDEGAHGGAEGRKQQVVVEVAPVSLPDQRQHHQDHDLAQPGLVVDALQRRQRLLHHRELRGLVAHDFRAQRRNRVVLAGDPRLRHSPPPRSGPRTACAGCAPPTRPRR